MQDVLRFLWFSASFCQQQWHQSLGSQAKPMKPYWSNMRDSCTLPYANPILGINVELLNLKTTIGLPLARHYQKAPLSRSRSKLSPPITCFSPWMAGLGDRIAHSAPIFEDLFWIGRDTRALTQFEICTYLYICIYMLRSIYCLY